VKNKPRDEDQSMNKNISLKVTFTNILGLIITGFSMTFGAWVIRPIGPTLSGVDLWLSLQATLSGSDLSPDAARQQAIFNWLTLIIVTFALQVFSTAFIFYRRKTGGWVISIILWAIISLAGVVLLLGYNAAVSGVIWLTFGSTAALIAESYLFIDTLTTQKHSHLQAIPKITQLWTATKNEAVEQNQFFSILAIHTNSEIGFVEMQKFQNELRGRDMIYSVQNGLFVLLWQVTPLNTPLIANKLLNIIQGYSTREVQIGSACFPSDGEDLKFLLEHATQALDSAMLVGGSLVIPFSSPASKEAREVLTPWEGLLAEAETSRTPVTTMYFKTSRALSLAEKYMVQKELRGRDLVTSFEDGFYVFLWNTNADGAKIVLSKLNQTLVAARIDSQVIIAMFPEDGNNLDELLKALDKQKT